MTAAEEILRQAHRIVLHDWPDQDVPDSLVRAGFDVTCYGGPAPDDVFRHEVVDGNLVTRKTGVPPESADLLYVYRPIEELPHLLAEAERIGARTIWRQSGLNEDGEKDTRGFAPSADSGQWRSAVEHAGLRYIEDAYIGDVARAVGYGRDHPDVSGVRHYEDGQQVNDGGTGA